MSDHCPTSSDKASADSRLARLYRRAYEVTFLIQGWSQSEESTPRPIRKVSSSARWYQTVLHRVAADHSVAGLKEVNEGDDPL